MVRRDRSSQSAGFWHAADGAGLPGGQSLHPPCQGMGMGYSDGMVIELKNFLAAIAEERMASASFADGLAVAKITGAAQRSSREGIWVEV